MATMMKTPEMKARSPGRQKYGFTSPNVKARVQEKEELSDLNDRLAGYIDCMRSLEHQNAKLAVEITTSKETRSREIENVRSMFEAELSESRKLLDDTSKENVLFKLENNKLNGILDELRPKYDQEQAANKRLQDKLKNVERRLNEKENLLATVSSERIDLLNRTKDYETQLLELQEKLAKDKEQMEREIIARIDAENRYQTLSEETKFTNQIHIKEVNELRCSAETQSYTYTVDETDGAASYDTILRDKLRELREEFEEEAENAKQELDDAYQAKFDEYRDQSDKDRAIISKLTEKLSDLKSEIDKLKTDNNVLGSKVEHFQKRIYELDNSRATDREDFKQQLDERDDKISDLQAKYDDLDTEYETLLGIKIALDMELAAYNKLLEGEEERLNIQTPERPSRRGTKRPHKESEEPTVENTATGNLVISNVDPCGKSVTLTNNGVQDEHIGGYYVHREVDGTDSKTDFQFSSTYILHPEQTVTIWSASQGDKLNPPNELVLTEGDWLVGGNKLTTTIVNKEAEIIAKHTVTSAETSTPAPRKMRRDGRAGEPKVGCTFM